MSLQVTTEVELNDPLDVIETVAAQSSMNVERVDATELHVNVDGMWRDIAVWFAWREDMRVLQMGAPLELKVPAVKTSEVCKLLAKVNERVWLGHFDLWSDDNGIVYRNGAVLSEMADFDQVQAEILIRGASEAFERFYPAFNYVIWGGKTAEEALEASLFEVQGTA
ncbi:YbjN domain-containing protein [Parvularcula sp. IMCC14364]|uniref:YbjN domain-containing protein n=1 Tax=Parvularcula sp. IMCC14364 TaxID=3067902 RepID=UPI002741675C|nr:YbjN domain-containing protein [Parvularcula sp. IMCC14364]